MSSYATWLYVILIHSYLQISTSEIQPPFNAIRDVDTFSKKVKQHKIPDEATPIDDSRINSGERTNNAQNEPVSIVIPLDSTSEQNKPVPNKRPDFVLEGGGVVEPSSINVTNVDQAAMIKNGDSSQPTGSKGRKGVKYPGSSVPRKGAVPLVEVPANNSGMSVLTNDQVMKDLSRPTSVSRPSESPSMGNSDQHVDNQSHEKPLHKARVKKPEVVSDADDADEFDKYTIIKTSTTGEDYVIIGIVIVIGIWFSVFGALIFYRRAGEYWDRRHYRRMDFLVEGMYND